MADDDDDIVVVSVHDLTQTTPTFSSLSPSDVGSTQLQDPLPGERVDFFSLYRQVHYDEYLLRCGSWQCYYPRCYTINKIRDADCHLCGIRRTIFNIRTGLRERVSKYSID
jgi:hypothetical protein